MIFRLWILNFAVLIFAISTSSVAIYRDELALLGQTTYLFRDYSLVIPVDIKRRQLPDEVFTDIKAWAA